MQPRDKDFRQGLEAHAGLIHQFQSGRVTDEEFRPIRLGYGLYYQLDHTSHMQRIKIPGGMLHARQIERIADLADRYGRGVGHVTTRQDIQLHWIPLEGVMDLYTALQEVGVSTRGACGDSIRNVTACPHAGLRPGEPFDVYPYARAISDYFLFNPLNLTLPRKFKIAVSCCDEDEAQAAINDIGLYARMRGEERGFCVYAGGGLGSQPYLARKVRDFLLAEDSLIMSEAIVRVQHRYGERKNRHKARMKFLLQRMGYEKYVKAVEEEFVRVERERGAELREELKEVVAAYVLPPPVLPPGPPQDLEGVGNGRGQQAYWLKTNTWRQKQAGYRMVMVNLPLGDFTTTQARVLADLIRRYGNGTLRITNDQNLLLPFIPEDTVTAIYEALRSAELGEANALHITDVTSCPGLDYCSLAVTRSMGVAERIRQHLAAGNGTIEELGRFRVKISGCPNSCGQHHVGDVGLTGLMVKCPDGQERPHYSILVGGGVGEGAARIAQRLAGRYPEEDTPKAVAALADYYRIHRVNGENFGQFVDRIGLERLTEIAQEAAGIAKH